VFFARGGPGTNLEFPGCLTLITSPIICNLIASLQNSTGNNHILFLIQLLPDGFTKALAHFAGVKDSLTWVVWCCENPSFAMTDKKISSQETLQVSALQCVNCVMNGKSIRQTATLTHSGCHNSPALERLK